MEDVEVELTKRSEFRVIGRQVESSTFFVGITCMSEPLLSSLLMEVFPSHPEPSLRFLPVLFFDCY